MAESLISVVVPTYNTTAEKLNRSLSSVIAQTYKNIEIFVIDDFSQNPFDGLDKRLIDSRIVWHRLKENSGVASVRNEGISLASGEYIAFLDDDDWWDKEKLEQQIKIFRDNAEVGLVYTSVISHDPQSRTIPTFAKQRGDLYQELLVTQPIIGSASSAMVRKEILDVTGGFYDKEDIPEDRELWLRIAKVCAVDFCPQFLVHLTVDQLGSRGADPVSKIATYSRFIDMYHDELIKYGLLKKAWSYCYLTISDKYIKQGQHLQAFKYLMVSCFHKIPSQFIIRLGAIFASMMGKKTYSFLRQKYNQYF
jgi:glycosyltransferase involved in cell wall biosynthesis